MEALLTHRGRPVAKIMNGDVDANRLLSFLTIMLAADGVGAVETALIAIYGGSRCHETGSRPDHDFLTRNGAR